MYSVASYGIPTFIPAGSWAWISGIASRTSRMTSSELAVGQHPDAHEDRVLPVELDVLVVVLGAEHDVGDVAQAHHDAAHRP